MNIIREQRYTHKCILHDDHRGREGRREGGREGGERERERERERREVLYVFL